MQGGIRNWRAWAQLALGLVLLASLAACSPQAQVSARERLFLERSLALVDAVSLPQCSFQAPPIGGLSALDYDPQSARFYALSDDGGRQGPPRFYTFRVAIERDASGATGIADVSFERVTPLKPEAGDRYPPGQLDPEGLARSPRETVFIASEGATAHGIAPTIAKFELASGRQQTRLELPEYYLPRPAEAEAQAPRGVAPNRGFESLTLGPTGTAATDPFRLFAAPERPLRQDRRPSEPGSPQRVRLLHYRFDAIGPPALLAEHIYPLESPQAGERENGLSELLALEQRGHFLSLERSYGPEGFGARIHQVAVGGATDISGIARLPAELGDLEPMAKQLLLDGRDRDLANWEGMALGPPLPDGSASLVVVSDNNFDPNQPTRLLLFRLVGAPQSASAR